ncbi:MAG: hypothetical protein B7Z15_07545, partial [Rhizobiales bacterium 32-66-8]
MTYLERAALMGLDLDRLRKGETLHAEVVIETLDHFTAIFGHGVNKSARAAFSFDLDTGFEGDAPVTQLLHHTYGNSVGTDAAEALFPMTLSATAGETVTIDSDIHIPASSPPYALVVGTLIFDGGSITVESTQATLSADTLKLVRGGTKSYYLGIIGKAGDPGPEGDTGTSVPGHASDGSSAKPKSPGICDGAGNGKQGSNGAPGGTGGMGGAGGTGLPSWPATITIRAVDPESVGQFVVYTLSGAGGKGGPGGTGGAGQEGGGGGKGCSSGAEGTNGGNGGAGGDGGAGGQGGPGGLPADGMGITINFPKAAVASLTTIPTTVSGGPGGDGGEGGAGGTGGTSGSGGTGHHGGNHGAAGLPGAKGPAGVANPSIGKAAGITINP